MPEKKPYVPDPRDGDPRYKKIFRPWKIDPKTGARIYPKNGKVFVIFVPADE